MAMLRLRLTGDDDAARAMMNLLQSLDGIEHVEEIADLMPHMDDPDSSSAGLSDLAGPEMRQIEIDAPNPSTARKVREAVQELAFKLDALVEFEEDEAD
jgi:ATP-dependent 26S proteasome regulatory subunit